MHKCKNDNCPHRLNALNKLNPAEKLLQKMKSSQFKLAYVYREYLFQAAELVHPGPNKPLVDINRIHNSPNILGLILSFYVSFAISARKTAYIAHSRETLPAVVTMTEAIRTADPQQKISLITDGNPSYPAGIHFMNEKRPQDLPRIEHHAVIGLQNLDQESETYRSFKQLIERLNRTFKFHVRPASGFKSDNGALSLVVLFATHYNFLRPHISLGYRTPVEIPELQNISTIQGQWIKILSMAE